MNSDNGSSVDHEVNQFHSYAAQGDVDGILTALKGIKYNYCTDET